MKKWPRRETIMFLERLELYISSGLTLDNAIRTATLGVAKSRSQSLIELLQSVESGGSLSQAMSIHIRLSPTISSLIEYGESSGQLIKSLQYGKSLLEKEDELKKKCFSAMVYPVIIGLFATILTLGLIKGVMPQIMPMLKSLNVELPLLTRIIMSVSDILSDYGLYILVGLIVIVSTLVFCYKKLLSFRYLCQSILVHIPIVGKLFNIYFVSIFCRSLGSLIESGVSLPKAYDGIVRTLYLEPLKESCANHSASVSRGVPLGSILQEVRGMPAYLFSLVSAGESSGTLGTSLIRAADIIDRDVDYALKRMTSLIEPVMMAGMGCVVGAIALSIMMPIYDVSKVLQH